MAEVVGKPFLEHLIGYWRLQGITRFILSIGYLGDSIRHHFGSDFSGAKIEYVTEDKPLGTGGALLECIKHTKIQSPFLMLNGDTYFRINLIEFYSFFKNSCADVALSLFKANDPARYMAIRMNSDDRIIELEAPETREEVEFWANGGTYIINPQKITAPADYELPLSFEKTILPHLMANQCHIYGVGNFSSFIDIGVPKDYKRARYIIDFAPNPLLK